jgi:glutathione S-transferase
MTRRSLYQRLRQNALVRLALFSLGCVLLVIAPVIGVLPGPGGIILFPIGLALALQNSIWAKRVYGRFKRRHPRYAAWTDRIMRRPSAARRRMTEKLLHGTPKTADGN